MDLIKQEFGRRLDTRDVAQLLGIDIKTVRKYYLDLGGVRIGGNSRSKIIFFEKRLINALSKQQQQQKGISVDGSNQDPGKEEKETVPDKKGSSGMGGRAKKEADEGSRSLDKHSLFV